MNKKRPPVDPGQLMASPAPSVPPEPQATPTAAANKAYKALTYRVTPETWRQLQALRIELDMPVTEIITAGINRILAEKGLKEIK